MLSVHRFQATCFAMGSRSQLRTEHVRRLFISGTRTSARTSRSPLTRRNIDFSPEEVSSSGGFSSRDPRLLGPFLFAIGFSGSCLTFATIWEYENMRTKALNFKQRATNFVQKHVQNPKHGEWRNQLNRWWKSLTEEQKLFYGLLMANLTVFVAWKIPVLQTFMLNYFCANPFARAVCWPMALSTFSHYSALHFGLNMFVLHSFMNGTAHSMGKEHFLGFYLSAGVFSSFAGYAWKAVTRTPGLSLGASGAIMGVLGYFCSQYPNALLQIAFVPGFTFSADSGLKAVMLFDTVGLLMRWKIFDHAAHLGGALFGLFWYHWGQEHIWNQRIGVLQTWHNFRTGARPGE